MLNDARQIGPSLPPRVANCYHPSSRIGLQKLMVDALCRKVDLEPFNPPCFELKHGHRPGGILKERMTDMQGNFFVGHHLPGSKVGGDDFLSQVLWDHTNTFFSPRQARTKKRYSLFQRKPCRVFFLLHKIISPAVLV